MSGNGDGMTIERRSYLEACDAYNNSAHAAWRLGDACRAYHKAIISLTPGLQFHQPDGTMRPVTLGDL